MAANAKKTIYINYNDSISDDRVRELSEFCLNKIEKHQPEILYFLFASPGGSTDAGITLYNFLRALPQKIVMHNMSSVDSIGTVVFLAGDERFASPHSTFLFHSVKNNMRKERTMDIQDVEELLSQMKEDQEKISSIISERSAFTKAEMNLLFNQGEVKSAKFAKEKEFVTDIKSLHLKKDDLIFNFYYNPGN